MNYGALIPMPAYDSRQVTPNVTPPGVGYDPNDPTQNPGASTSTTLGSQDRTKWLSLLAGLSALPLALRFPAGRTAATQELRTIGELIQQRVPSLVQKAGALGDIAVQARTLPEGTIGQAGSSFGDQLPKWLALNREWLTPENRSEMLATTIHELLHPLVAKKGFGPIRGLAEHAEYRLPFEHLEDIVNSPGSYYASAPWNQPRDVINELAVRLMEHNIMRRRFPEYFTSPQEPL